MMNHLMVLHWGNITQRITARLPSAPLNKLLADSTKVKGGGEGLQKGTRGVQRSSRNKLGSGGSTLG